MRGKATMQVSRSMYGTRLRSAFRDLRFPLPPESTDTLIGYLLRQGDGSRGPRRVRLLLVAFAPGATRDGEVERLDGALVDAVQDRLGLAVQPRVCREADDS